MFTKKIMTKQEKLEMEAFREDVMNKELIARANKAEYERMFYYVGAHEISEKYLELYSKDVAKREEKMEEFRKAQEEAMKQTEDLITND